MQPEAKKYLTPEEYLANERVAEYKSEYFAGEVFALAGASRRHNLIMVNMIAALSNRLRGGSCEVYSSDMRVKVDELGKYTYPDVVVACGALQFEDSEQDTLANPTMIVEILSDSTEAYDRGGKFEHYRRIESLREYVLVAQDRHRVEHFLRLEDGHWLFSEIAGLEGTLALGSIGCELPMAEVYYKVDLPEASGTSNKDSLQ